MPPGARTIVARYLCRLLLTIILVYPSAVARAESPPELRIGAPVASSKVPLSTRQGTFLSPQSIAALDISADGRRIGVATMSFSHDRNLWVLSAQGEIVSSRYVFPWAPFQVGLLGDGACGVGLA